MCEKRLANEISALVLLRDFLDTQWYSMIPWRQKKTQRSYLKIQDLDRKVRAVIRYLPSTFFFLMMFTIFLLGVFVAPGFNCAIAACEKSKDWHQALKLLEATFDTSGPRLSRWYDIHLPIFRKISWWNFQGFLEFSPLTLGRWSNFVLFFRMGWNY